MLSLKKKFVGMTLVELLVALGILSIATLGMSVLFYVAWSSQSFQLKLGQAAFIASRGVSATIKNIRQAQQGDDGSYPLKSGGDFDIVFHANIDEDTAVERLHYYLSGNTFYLGVTKPSATPPYTYSTGDQTTTIISSNVVNTSADRVFRYYDGNGTLLTTPVATGSVRMISVHLLIDIDPFSSPVPLSVTSRTTLRNLISY